MRPVLVMALVVSACGGPAETTPASAGCADVESVEVIELADATFRFDVTVASADTGWDKYADAWEIRSQDGEVLGTRVLAHPHVDEQPFTRSLAGVEIPDYVREVQVAARDSVEGFCGRIFSVPIP